jgi:hypothetical protein
VVDDPRTDLARSRARGLEARASQQLNARSGVASGRWP